MSKSKFCVALNGRPGNVEWILERYGNCIYEVFSAAPPEICPTGRWGHFPISKNEIKRQVALAHKYKVRYNVLLNGSCMGGMQFSEFFQKKIIDFVKFLDEVKTDSVTVVDPFIISLIRKHSKIHIIAGSWTEVVEPVKARRLVKLGVNRIVLHQNVYRDFEMLKKIRESVNIELEIIPNQGCLFQCECFMSHVNMVSHASIATPEELKNWGDFDYAIKRCTKIRQIDPIEFLMSCFIRPEDLSLYEGLGYNIFKIAGRNRSAKWMSNCLSAYLKRSYDGNVFDLSCHFDENKKITFLPNKSLEGWYQYMGSIKDWEEFRKRAKEFYQSKKLKYFFKKAGQSLIRKNI